MKKLYSVCLVILMVFIIGCADFSLDNISDKDLERISEKAVVCKEPYIRVGVNCCLDTNNNGICDNDEGNVQPAEELHQPEKSEMVFDEGDGDLLTIFEVCLLGDDCVIASEDSFSFSSDFITIESVERDSSGTDTVLMIKMQLKDKNAKLSPPNTYANRAFDAIEVETDGYEIKCSSGGKENHFIFVDGYAQLQCRLSENRIVHFREVNLKFNYEFDTGEKVGSRIGSVPPYEPQDFEEGIIDLGIVRAE